MNPSIDPASYASAMSGYKAPQSSQPQQSGGSSLSGILGMALNMLPFVVPEIGIPARMAVGAVTNGISNEMQGKGLNLGSDILGGITDGVMGGMMGAGKTAATDLAANAGTDLASGAATDAAANTASDLTGTASNAVDSTPGYEVGTNIKLNQSPTGEITTASITPPEPTVTPKVPESVITPTPVSNPNVPAPQTSPTDTFTQAPKPEGSNLNILQKEGNSITQNALKSQIQNGGSRLTQAEADQLAANLKNDGYNNLSQAAQDAQHVTGNTGILSNGVNDHINNAEANGASINLGDYYDLAQQHINNALMSGVLTPAQETAARNTLNSIQNILAGPGAADVTDTSTLTHVIPSNNLNAVRALQGQAHAQDLIAQGRGISAEGAKQLSKLYSNMGNSLLDRGFGVANGNAPISDANLNNMIAQIKDAPFNNPTYQQNLIDTLEAGKGGKMSLQDLRHLQANHVGYANAASPNEVSNLTNGLMSAGLNKTGITNAVLNSDPGLTLKAKAGRAITKLGTPSGETALTNDKKGAIMKTPLGKAAALAGIISALGLGADTALSGNQSSQANAILNNPQYQQTQNVLNQSNALQRYLGQMGEIRSIFAPTFDSNAAQAGSSGLALLNAANNNSAARTAANNLLTARSQMGHGGILGNILALIPGTPENTYAKQAANAQAQLNALGVPGVAPSVAQGNTIPALSSMAGNVGNF